MTSKSLVSAMGLWVVQCHIKQPPPVIKGLLLILIGAVHTFRSNYPQEAPTFSDFNILSPLPTHLFMSKLIATAVFMMNDDIFIDGAAFFKLLFHNHIVS